MPNERRLVDVTSCVDVDECAEDNGGCEGECSNKPGTYTCELFSRLL